MLSLLLLETQEHVIRPDFFPLFHHREMKMNLMLANWPEPAPRTNCFEAAAEAEHVFFFSPNLNDAHPDAATYQ